MNFKDLSLFTKVFCVKFGGVVLQFVKVLSYESFRYTVYHYNTYVIIHLTSSACIEHKTRPGNNQVFQKFRT